ncbi:pseudoazurin [Palleronia pelagia]|uniref:Pseudoazurin n=1 Tax=Palleronia pelagia TaxID=387096 RepID=A0A1H8L3W6_9RHOB|nr:pseudoazurin [Palleronia pelagia]SEN99815.1 pseudoazurin [Palleronia pelagia]
MKITRRNLIASASAAAILSPAALRAQNSEPTVHEVEMLNRDPDTGDIMVFRPAVIKVNPGDTVRFVATDRGHNSEAFDDAVPEGVEAWNGNINEEFEITLDTEGAYGYHCTPHLSAGMVGIILVGDNVDNLDALRDVRVRGRASARWEDYIARAEEMMAETAS